MEKFKLEMFFGPSIALMKRLKYPQKFGIISCSILALIAGIIFLFMSNLQAQIDFNSKENLGVEYITPVKDFLAEVQTHRNLSTLSLKGDSSVNSKISQVETEIDNIVDKITKTDEKLNTNLVVEDKFKNLKEKWSNLESNYKNLSVKENFDKHTELINETIALISHLADKSNLTLDPDLDTFYMMDAFCFKLPVLLEKITLSKIEGSKIISGEKNDKTELIKLHTLLDEANEFVKGGKDVILNSNPSLKDEISNNFNAAYNSNKEFMSLIDKLIIGSTVSTAEYNIASVKSFDSSKKLYNQYSDILYRLIEKRVKKYSDQIPVAIFFTILVSLLIGYLFAGFYLCLMNSLKEIEYVSKKVAEGDLTTRIKPGSKDEIADLDYILNSIFENLNKIVTDLFLAAKEVQKSSGNTKLSAEQALQGAEQTSMSTTQLAQGTQDMSLNIENSANTVSKLNKGIQDISEKAVNIANLGEETEDNANEGKVQVKEAVNKIDSIKNVTEEISGTITELGKLSTEIEQIVDLIKNIAAQTNLLALNAAIEAARAGEHGKGFAVVAGEVNKLASQSAAATDQITGMIKEIQTITASAVMSMGKANNEVNDGVLVINNAGKSLENIINHVKNANIKVLEMKKEIAEIAENSEGIVKMLENISAVTEETAASAEEISSITHEQANNVANITHNAQVLSEIAETLNKQFSVYKV